MPPEANGGRSLPIDNPAHLPIYRVVAEQIATRITSGQWGAGTVLPAEVALAREFGVSVGTVRRALGELTANGLLARRRKTGTVVTGRSPRHSLRFFYDYFRLHTREGALQTSVTRVLARELRPATPQEAAALQIQPGAPVHCLHRLRLIGTRPVMHGEIVLPEHLVPGLPDDPDEMPERLYMALWHDYGLKISAIRERIEADLADATDCELLGMTAPAAVLVINEIAYDEMARPILINTHRACTRQDVYINEVQ